MDIYEYFNNDLSDELKEFLQSQLDIMKEKLPCMISLKNELCDELKNISQLKIIDSSYTLTELRNKLEFNDMIIRDFKYQINEYGNMIVQHKITNWTDIKNHKFIEGKLKQFNYNVSQIKQIIKELK
jgi:RecG-like helicase